MTEPRRESFVAGMDAEKNKAFIEAAKHPFIELKLAANVDRDALLAGLKKGGVPWHEEENRIYINWRQARRDKGQDILGNWRVSIPNVTPDYNTLHLLLDKSVKHLDFTGIQAHIQAYAENPHIIARLELKERDLDFVRTAPNDKFHVLMDRCTINNLQLNDFQPQQIVLNQCSAGLLEAHRSLDEGVIKRAEFLQIKEKLTKVDSGTYYILQIDNLENKLTFGRAVEIVYDETILQKWYKQGLKSSELWKGSSIVWQFNLVWTSDRKDRNFGLTDPDLNRNLINTYVELLKNPTLQAHEIALQRCLAYFRSRANWFTRLLFLINGGFYRITVPAVLAGLFLAASVVCIASAGPEYFAKVGELILNPLKYWSEFVLHEANLSRPLSWPKLIGALLHPPLLYLVFSTAVAIKRRFGFPKE